MTPRPLRLVQRLAPRFAALLVLVLGLSSTLAAWMYVSENEQARANRRFYDAVEQVTQTIEHRLAAYISVLLATRGFLDASETITRDEFQTFIQSVEVGTRFPGVQGLGFAAWISEDERPAFEARLRAQGLPDYRVWPEGPRARYAPIAFIEPQDWRNRRAMGFDMYSDPVRRDAMDRAREHALPAATAQVRLVQETDVEPQAGFLIYVPVYTRAATDVGEPSDQRLRGFVYAPFRTGDLFGTLLGPAAARAVSLAIYDGSPHEGQPPLFINGTQPETGSPVLTATRHLDVAGRRWTLVFRSTERLTDLGSDLPLWVALGGVLISLLLFVITRAQVRARAAAEESDRRSALLAEVAGVLSSSLDGTEMLTGAAALVSLGTDAACAVELLEPDGAVRSFLAVPGPDEPRIETRRRPGHPEHIGLDRAITADRSRMLAHTDPALDRLLPEDFLALLGAAARSAVLVPLRARGRAIGSLSLVWTAPRRRQLPADLATAQDLGRLIAAAADNAQLYRDAQDAIRVRDEFLSVASHELKTPLTSLQLQVQSILRALERGRAAALTPDALRDKAGLIDSSVQRMSNLISSLLDIARITSGRLVLSPADTDLSALARDVCARFSDEARAADVPLVASIEDGVVGRWDAQRLDQIVSNLLSNAIKYGPGQPVDVTLERRGDVARLEVRDRGIGVPPEDQARIFDQFERAVSTRNYGGFGLGLWISRQIVEAHGGSIAVTSEPGQGATFTVTLPL